MDRTKEQSLKLAYQQVSKDFGSIFGTLLPGANARLVPPPGKSILQGLEVNRMELLRFDPIPPYLLCFST